VAQATTTLRLTVDPLEFRGFGYTTGFAFALFDAVTGEELGRGGRYLGWGAEPATGVTLYPEAVLRVASPGQKRARAYLPSGTPTLQGARLRAEGWATVHALGPDRDPVAEAKRLGCSHLWQDGALRPAD
jgi:ATP phosphoribosyltransferase regulatory subunit